LLYIHVVPLIESKGSTITTATPHAASLPVSAATAREITGNIWLSRSEAASYLGIATKTLASHIHDGPPSAKFFGSIRYRLADLDSWAKQQVRARR
jgi:hypothetical protein